MIGKELEAGSRTVDSSWPSKNAKQEKERKRVDKSLSHVVMFVADGGNLQVWVIKYSILSPPIHTRRIVPTQETGHFSLLLLRVWP